jgi:hypothetical protein
MNKITNNKEQSMQNKTNTPNANIKKITTVENSKESFKNKAGDVIEKVGHKISEAGMPKVGQKIHDMGDALEDKHKNPSHPHKV